MRWHPLPTDAIETCDAALFSLHALGWALPATQREHAPRCGDRAAWLITSRVDPTLRAHACDGHKRQSDAGAA
jgi:hypothetical protein